MALLVSFFVMLVAFSTQDSAKLQVVAGSMREAFGVQDKVRYSGIIEIARSCRPGRSSRTPRRSRPRRRPPIRPRISAAASSRYGGKFDNDRNFALAAASLRQALQDMPEISEVSKNIMIEETKQGLNIEIVDQNGRSMFPEGSKEPYERTRHADPAARRTARAMPFRISIAGHTSASKLPAQPGYGPWELSADRANAVRKQLETEGVPTASISSWWRAAPTPSRCFRTIPISPPIAA